MAVKKLRKLSRPQITARLKREVPELDRLVREFILKHGGEVCKTAAGRFDIDKYKGDEYRLPCRAGPLVVHVDKNPGSILSVFGRFEAATKKQLPSDANPYSYKWNFHMGTNADDTETVTAQQVFNYWAASMRTQIVVKDHSDA